MPVATLRTDRLVLRPWRLTDVDAVFAYASDPEFFRYLTVPAVETLEEERRWIDEQLSRDPKVHPAWAITLGDVPIGAIHALVNRANRVAEMGYGVGRAWWNQGYTSEAAFAVGNWLFANTGIERLAATADSRNTASWRVMEKLGMSCDRVGRGHRVVRGESADTVYYSIRRYEWEARR
jgi:ribosomal-protein-alanine N-acetyltransferase